METLYKVLLVCCLLFFAAGVVYVLYFLPKASAAPAAVLPAMNSGIECAGNRLE
ncbi:hypothetical protein G3578_04510 [Brevibacillus sp. SYP-B805]|uniref:hypothetical protein n=1 Tax=Brevibacillus sp. SYP-B805 TaxID=1578199 RepID=UPI0013EA071C|nr:hypothetical protein [Brevibacillus sp. SYP-B805]NGQ94439.1 hypothetical protein [Brevibacillus sp. SYP-B805]